MNEGSKILLALAFRESMTAATKAPCVFAQDGTARARNAGRWQHTVGRTPSVLSSGPST